MKNLFLLFLFFPLTLLAQKKFTVSGIIKGLPDKSEITLTNANVPTDTVAKAMVQNGKFVLTGMVEEPNLYQLNLNAVQKKTIVFLSNDNITLKGDVDKLQELMVTGSPVHQDFQEFQQIFNPLFQRLSELNQQVGNKPNIQRDDTLMIAYTQQIEKIKSAIDHYILNRKSSPVAPFLLVVTSELDQDMATLEKRFNILDSKIQNGFYGKILRQQIEDSKIGAVGTPAIEFIQPDTTGKPVSLNSFRGKYVLVDFWASWCKPCRIENPNVVAAFNKFKEKNFTILGVSLDRSREPWMQAIKDDNLYWTQVSDLKFWNNEVAVKYKITMIPQNFLIDPEGKIVGRNLRGPELTSKLCELLGCN